MKIIKKYQYSGQLNPVTIEDYLNYWRDNNVETDEALLQRLAEKYGPNHMQNWIAQRQYEINNPQSVHTGTGVITPTPKKSMSTKLADSFEDMITSNTLEGGLARTLGASTLGAMALTNLPTVLGGIIGGELVDKAVGGFGEQVQDLTGIDSRVADFFNPGYFVGGYLGNVPSKLFKAGKASISVPKMYGDTYSELIKFLKENVGDFNSVDEFIEAIKKLTPYQRTKLSNTLRNKYKFDLYRSKRIWKDYRDEVPEDRQWLEYFRMGIPKTPINENADVQTFYSTIIKPRIQEYEKIPEIDDLFGYFDVNEAYAQPGTAGYTLDGGIVNVLDKFDFKTLAHELHHALRNLLIKRTYPNPIDFDYYSTKEEQLLRLFPYYDIGEVGASLLESKFAIFMDLKKALNRYPTLEEFEAFVKKMDVDTLYKYFREGGYYKDIAANKKLQLADRIEEAMINRKYPEGAGEFTSETTPEEVESVITDYEYKKGAENLRNAFLKLGMLVGAVGVSSTE